MVDQAALTGRHFLRVSKDKSGRERSNTEQADDNEARWGFTFVGEPYREAASASRYAKKRRDEFPQLLADLKAGRFGADVLVMWEGSRGSRKVSEWVTLIEQCEETGVLIAITEDERIYNPGNARDRKDLIANANDAEYESARSSGRIKRNAAAVAAAGRSIGPVNYGYRRIYDEHTREFIRQEPDPDEAPIIEELFARVEAGHSFRAIARDLEARGIVGRYGKPHGPAQLRKMAGNPAYIGKRTHSPYTDWKSKPKAERIRSRTLVDAWPPIVDERRWLAVQRIINSPGRMTSDRPGRALYMFSQIIRCDKCDGPMGVVKYRSPDGHYYCQVKGCAMIPKPPVDDIIEAEILGFLSRPDNVGQLTSPDSDAELDDIRLEVARVRAELDQLYADSEAGNVSPTIATRTEAGFVVRLQAAERREQELSTPPALRALIEPGADVRKRWRAAPVSTKRRVARILLSPEVLGEVRILPANGTKGQIVERVRWRTDAS